MRRLFVTLTMLFLFVTSCGGSAPQASQGAPLLEQGVNLYVTADPSVDTSIKLNARLNQTFAYLRTLQVNAVALEFPLYVNGVTGKEVTAGPKTPSLDMLRQIITFATNREMQVKLRPVIDPQNLGGQPASELQPENRARWFATYALALRPYAELAGDTGVQEFQVGSELSSLEGDLAWQVVLYEVNQVFRRAVTYTVNWERLEVGKAKSPTNVYGVAAYPSFDLPDSTPLSELAVAWERRLGQLSEGYGLKRLVLDEVSIPGAAGMYGKPWTPHATVGLEANQQVQAGWFISACEAARRHQLRGIYFSGLDLARDPFVPLRPNERLDLFTGRLGAAAIKACFAPRP